MARYFGSTSLFLAGFVLVGASSAAAAAGDTLYVEVSSTKIRKEPKHWSAPVGSLNFGDKLKELSLAGGWYETQSEKGQGWVHESALTSRKVKLKSFGPDPDIRPDESDIVLAGKGFNKDVEASYATTDATLDFGQVNEIEKAKVGEEELIKFLRAGKLNSQ